MLLNLTNKRQFLLPFTSIENQYKVDFKNMAESLRYFENEEYYLYQSHIEIQIVIRYNSS